MSTTYPKSTLPSLIYGIPTVSAPLVSIIIPTYKRLGPLCEAVESVLAQPACLPYEVIVIDNDQSSEILEAVRCFCAKRIAVYQNPSNVGMWGNINRGLALAKGTWLLILCDDDLLGPDALIRFMRVLQETKAKDAGCICGATRVLITAGVEPIFNRACAQTKLPLAWHIYSSSKLLRVDSELRFIDIPKLCSAFFRRDYVVELGGWDSACHGFADLALFLRIQQDRRLFAFPEVIGCFRVHGANESNPSRVWDSYPVAAAERVLAVYIDDTTGIGKSVRRMVEKSYTSCLWKTSLETERRRAYADALARKIIKSPMRRLLVRQVWLLDVLAYSYARFRPLVGMVLKLARVRRSAPLSISTDRRLGISTSHIDVTKE